MATGYSEQGKSFGQGATAFFLRAGLVLMLAVEIFEEVRDALGRLAEYMRSMTLFFIESSIAVSADGALFDRTAFGAIPPLTHEALCFVLAGVAVAAFVFRLVQRFSRHRLALAYALLLLAILSATAGASAWRGWTSPREPLAGNCPRQLTKKLRTFVWTVN
jgi:hypothetical protein